MGDGHGDGVCSGAEEMGRVSVVLSSFGDHGEPSRFHETFGKGQPVKDGAL